MAFQLPAHPLSRTIYVAPTKSGFKPLMYGNMTDSFLRVLDRYPSKNACVVSKDSNKFYGDRVYFNTTNNLQWDTIAISKPGYNRTKMFKDAGFHPTAVWRESRYSSVARMVALLKPFLAKQDCRFILMSISFHTAGAGHANVIIMERKIVYFLKREKLMPRPLSMSMIHYSRGRYGKTGY